MNASDGSGAYNGGADRGLDGVGSLLVRGYTVVDQFAAHVKRPVTCVRTAGRLTLPRPTR